ncbi:hypothetical protein JM946_10560 [Steroidobacter sp. S1-65]|uniref:Helix-turn-helix domain-containing protein n=1 Tax=Steroidobacter gossypii TaxID=2805490 RepID=A0ABS1WW38_9GAMM|nr:hypothetical protein [Steroidobacter gossypii]MBM0105196.1 hypothetical protein [Steroidobacter gossypii]
MTAVDDRRPNWAKWRFVPDVEIWEGVALSLNIEPDKVNHHPHGWMADAHLFLESEEFNDRIFVLKRNRELRRTAVSLDDPVHSEVSLSEFAAYALSVGWKIPDELKGMAVAHVLTEPRTTDLRGSPPDPINESAATKTRRATAVSAERRRARNAQRDRRIHDLYAAGKSRKEISREVGLSDSQIGRVLSRSRPS